LSRIDSLKFRPFKLKDETAIPIAAHQIPNTGSAARKK
jgi:hypothetical protein